jgi:uncharacterized FAD-dependent dehydrogenase
MALRLREVTLPLEQPEETLPQRVAAELDLPSEVIADLRIVRRGFDARHKPRVLKVYTVEFTVADEAGQLARHHANPRLERVLPVAAPAVAPLGIRHRVLVVGMGPAGLFAALQLARYGLQVTLMERGRPVEERVRDVRRFW